MKIFWKYSLSWIATLLNSGWLTILYTTSHTSPSSWRLDTNTWVEILSIFLIYEYLTCHMIPQYTRLWEYDDDVSEAASCRHINQGLTLQQAGAAAIKLKWKLNLKIGENASGLNIEQIHGNSPEYTSLSSINQSLDLSVHNLKTFPQIFSIVLLDLISVNWQLFWYFEKHNLSILAMLYRTVKLVWWLRHVTQILVLSCAALYQQICTPYK